MRVKFEDFCLDASRRELVQAELPVLLSPKAFDLLLLLLQRSLEVLPATEAFAVLWPDGVFDMNRITELVQEIRQALGDREHRMVRTMFGRGYVFAAPTIPVEERPASHCQLIIDSCGHDLPVGETIVGRDARATIRIDTSTVSRRHARITVDGPRATLQDLGSHNGTLVDGRRIDSVELHDGDEVTFGAVKAKFVVVIDV